MKSGGGGGREKSSNRVGGWLRGEGKENEPPSSSTRDSLGDV